MHSVLLFCHGLLAFSTLVSASYRDHPRNYVRSLMLDNTSVSTSSMTTTSSSHVKSSPKTRSSTPSVSVSESSSNSSTSSIDVLTSSQPSCLGSVTYYSTAPPTVYETTTIPFTVTVTAANVSLSTPAIYTPPPPCVQSIVVPAATTTCVKDCPLNNPAGAPLTGSAYTSTVLVTKKTPVPTVVPNSSPPPDFHLQSTTPPTSPSAVQSPTPPPQSQDSGTGQSSGGGNGGSPAPASTATQGNGGSQITNAGDNGPAPSVAAANQGSTGASGPTPTSANVNGVPVIVLPSSSGVVIGGQVVSVPSSGSATTVVANGNTFTLAKSSIVGPGTTIALAADQAGASPTPVTANGLTFKVGATQAIISGTTYAIGVGAPTTTLTLGGQTVVVGPSGVGLPGQTIAPEKATAGSSMSVVTAGGVTITYDQSEAILGSSTYRIGAGASPTFVTVDGKTISIGVGGVGLASSTIAPAKVTAAPSLSAVTADGVSFSIDATEVVIGSSTYRIGSGAPTETTVINGKTISIGPSGVGLGSTTVHPPAATGASHTGSATSPTTERRLGSFVLSMIAALLGCLLV